MNKDELVKKLEDIEWEDFEVKEAHSEVPKNAWETVSAFSNTAGGWLIFGVSKKGKQYEIIGVDNPEKIEQDFTTALRTDKFNQKITPKLKKYRVDKKAVLAFYIPASGRKPVFFNAIANTFIRTGSGDQHATKEETDAMLRQTAFIAKDKEITSLRLKDLDSRTISDYKRYLRDINPEHPYNQLSNEMLLEKLNVLANGRVTVGGLLVFGKQDAINRLLTDFRVDYLEIPGTSYSDAPTKYTFRLSEEENLFRFYFSIIPRLIKKIDIPFRMRADGLATDDQPQVVAIREALVNLLMHTDYFSTMKPRIRVFTDRIEFMNPGSLPKPFETIMKEDFTQPRNPTIARIFRSIKLSENAGSGFEKMFAGWSSCYARKPAIQNEVDYYKITFDLELNEKYKKEGAGETTQKLPRNYPEHAKKDLERDLVKDLEKNLVKLTSNQKRILVEISKNRFITQQELSKLLGINEKNVRNNITKLKGKKLLKRVGPDKGGHWEVIATAPEREEQ